MNFQAPNSKYNLEERTAKLAELVIELVKELPQDYINRRMIEQCVASAGSIGANYCEANEGESKKDFQHKIGISKKEIKETMHWFRLLAKANPEKADRFRKLWQEAHELLLIFSTIISSCRNGKKEKIEPSMKIDN